MIDIPHHDVQVIIEPAQQQHRILDFRDRPDFAAKGFERGPVMLVQLDPRHHQHVEAQPPPVEIDILAANDPHLLKMDDPARTGRLRYPRLFGNLGHRAAAIGLHRAQYAHVGFIQFRHILPPNIGPHGCFMPEAGDLVQLWEFQTGLPG